MRDDAAGENGNVEEAGEDNFSTKTESSTPPGGTVFTEVLGCSTSNKDRNLKGQSRSSHGNAHACPLVSLTPSLHGLHGHSRPHVILVEGWRYQDHSSFLIYSPSQLNKMLPSFDLQKMSEQGVWTHPSMSLLVLLSSILIFSWGPSPHKSLGILTSFNCVRAFYSARSFVHLNGGKTFWLS